MTVEAFGGDFGRNEGADWRKFLEVIGGAARPTGAPPERELGTTRRSSATSSATCPS